MPGESLGHKALHVVRMQLCRENKNAYKEI